MYNLWRLNAAIRGEMATAPPAAAVPAHFGVWQNWRCRGRARPSFDKLRTRAVFAARDHQPSAELVEARQGERARGQVKITVAVASAAMPSRRPVKPSPSVVVAFT